MTTYEESWEQKEIEEIESKLWETETLLEELMEKEEPKDNLQYVDWSKFQCSVCGLKGFKNNGACYMETRNRRLHNIRPTRHPKPNHTNKSP